jgi:uncharacterized protein YodC (DUF2158 family)
MHISARPALMNKILYPTENKSTMNNQFKPGDAVKLKISNMQMMIRGIANIPSEQESIAIKERYECVWYDNAKLQRAIFSKELLEWLAPNYDVLHFGNYE